MKNKSKVIMVVVFSVVFVAGTVGIGRRLVAQAPAWQAATGSVTVVLVSPRPGIQGSATGEVKPFERESDDVLKDILAQPAPVISLAFPGSEDVSQQLPTTPHFKVNLPFEATEATERYWRAYLGFLYRTEYQHVPDAQTQINEDHAIGALANATMQKLQQMIIVAPDGPRKISYEEAGSIIKFIGLSAYGVVRQAKEQK